MLRYYFHISHVVFVGKINTASIPIRYPEDLQRALKDYPEPVAQDYLRKTEDLLRIT